MKSLFSLFEGNIVNVPFTFKRDSVGNWYAIPIPMVSEFELLDSDEDHELDFCDMFEKYQTKSPSQWVSEMLGENDE